MGRMDKSKLLKQGPFSNYGQHEVSNTTFLQENGWDVSRAT